MLNNSINAELKTELQIKKTRASWLSRQALVNIFVSSRNTLERLPDVDELSRKFRYIMGYLNGYLEKHADENLKITAIANGVVTKTREFFVTLQNIEIGDTEIIAALENIKLVYAEALAVCLSNNFPIEWSWPRSILNNRTFTRILIDFKYNDVPEIDSLIARIKGSQKEVNDFITTTNATLHGLIIGTQGIVPVLDSKDDNSVLLTELAKTKIMNSIKEVKDENELLKIKLKELEIANAELKDINESKSSIIDNQANMAQLHMEQFDELRSTYNRMLSQNPQNLRLNASRNQFFQQADEKISQIGNGNSQSSQDMLPSWPSH
jgi:hypothetical protein